MSNSSSRARITVERPAPDELGEQYGITLTLDGERIGRLRPGESVSRDVEPGSHRLRASNTLLSKTVTFDATAGEPLCFLTENRQNRLTAIFGFLGAGLLSVSLERA